MIIKGNMKQYEQSKPHNNMRSNSRKTYNKLLIGTNSNLNSSNDSINELPHIQPKIQNLMKNVNFYYI
jgi:hypothetical protein